VVKTKVPPGPNNPLGKYWLQLSSNALGIHGTNAPWSVGKYATHGCVRMRAGDIARLYKDVPDGTAVDVVDSPVKLADVDGRILLEAHRGIGGHVPRSIGPYVERLRASEVGARIDVAAAERVIRAALGVAIDVTAPAPVSVTARAD
jgi:L,D-transpeptidase ErfK/SrfK